MPCFTALPCEILELIFGYLAKDDVVRMALVSQEFRDRILPFAMREMKASWHQILEIHKSGTSNSPLHRAYVQQLRITDSNSYNEYQMSTFLLLLSPEIFPALARVLVNSSNLSYWLKYNECLHITHLTLYSDEAIKSVKTFNLSHVNNFKNLRLLMLHNYHFNWTEEEELRVPRVPLSTLVLHDCTWEYPFNLTSFNRLNILESLTIEYSLNNPFTLLERFENFLNDPLLGHLDSLRNLSVRFVGYTQNFRYLSTKILAQFVSRFQNLENLRFEGWAAHLNMLKVCLSCLDRNVPLNLHMRLKGVDLSDRELFGHLHGSVRVKWI